MDKKSNKIITEGNLAIILENLENNILENFKNKVFSKNIKEQLNDKIDKVNNKIEDEITQLKNYVNKNFFTYENCPPIKILEGTTSEKDGGSVSVLHETKNIISIFVIINYENNCGVSNNFKVIDGQEFNYYYDKTKLHIINATGNSQKILGKNFKAVIFYKE
jgi:hypothetical protein